MNNPWSFRPPRRPSLSDVAEIAFQTFLWVSLTAVTIAAVAEVQP